MELVTVLVAQCHLLEAVVLVVVDDETGGVVQEGRFQFIVKVAASAAHQGDPRHVGRRQDVVVSELAAVVRAPVGRHHVDEEAGRGRHATRSVLTQLGCLSAANERRRLLHVHVRHVHLSQRVLVTVKRPLNPSIKPVITSSQSRKTSSKS